jgi:hypothetical protein
MGLTDASSSRELFGSARRFPAPKRPEGFVGALVEFEPRSVGAEREKRHREALRALVSEAR